MDEFFFISQHCSSTETHGNCLLWGQTASQHFLSDFSYTILWYLGTGGVCFVMKRIKTTCEWALKDSIGIVRSRPLSSKKDKRSHSIFRHFSWPRRHWWWSIRSRIRIDGCKNFSWDFLDIFFGKQKQF